MVAVGERREEVEGAVPGDEPESQLLGARFRGIDSEHGHLLGYQSNR